MAESRRVLVPGAGGFFGRRVVEALTGAGHRVTGLTRDELDLTRIDAVRNTVAAAAPEVIVNAAGIPSPRTCREDPAACFRANTEATFNLLEAIRLDVPGCRLVVLSSAAVYGPGVGEPLTELDPPAPHSIYGAAKLAAEVLTGQYIRQGKVSATTLRTFNLIGPGQPPEQAASEFARDIREALDRGETRISITVGDPQIARDFTDVRDAARAVAGVIDLPGVFNLCSGRTSTLLELADTLTRLAREHRNPDFSAHLETDPGRNDPGDPRNLRGRPDRLRTATGWTPRIPIEQSLDDLLFPDVQTDTLG